MPSFVAGIKVEVHIPGSNVMFLQVGMAALLDKADQMASMDWRVAPVPWRESLASPGRPLKVPMHMESESKSSSLLFGRKKSYQVQPRSVSTQRTASSRPPPAWSEGLKRLCRCYAKPAIRYLGSQGDWGR